MTHGLRGPCVRWHIACLIAMREFKTMVARDRSGQRAEETRAQTHLRPREAGHTPARVCLVALVSNRVGFNDSVELVSLVFGRWGEAAK